MDLLSLILGVLLGAAIMYRWQKVECDRLARMEAKTLADLAEAEIQRDRLGAAMVLACERYEAHVETHCCEYLGGAEVEDEWPDVVGQ